MNDTMPDELTLEDRLSEPTDAVIQSLARLPGDFIFLGVGGKMGPSLARMARRAMETAGKPRRIIGVSRFSNPSLEPNLNQAGIETIRCDLLDASAIDTLPEAPNVIFMTGMKFGSTGEEARMWAMNTLLPARLAQRYASSRWLAFSTGNVYPMVTPQSGGSRETDRVEPVGEYGMSCLGRERVLEYCSRTQSTPVSVFRLNYACDLRYGVLVDLAQAVWTGQPVDLSMGYFNTIWQGDANALALHSLSCAASPPFIVNVTGRELLSTREVSEQLGQLMDKPVSFKGQEKETALLSNTSKMTGALGQPRVDANTLIQWVAHWVMNGYRTLGKATHFQTRDGRF